VENILNAYLLSVNEKPNKTQMESFLSVVQFGQYEVVPLEDVARIIYEYTIFKMQGRLMSSFMREHNRGDLAQRLHLIRLSTD
jgi:hypothetical protein